MFWLLHEKTKPLSREKIGRMSTKSVDLSSPFFQQFAVAFDLRQQGQGGWVTLLGGGTGAGPAHKLMKVSNLGVISVSGLLLNAALSELLVRGKSARSGRKLQGTSYCLPSGAGRAVW